VNDPEAPVDVAKQTVNERILALGLDGVMGSYESMYTGLPVTHDEADYVLGLVAQDVGERLAAGVPINPAMTGALHWLFLVGLFAGKGATA
jgi:hypothetical protein